MHPPIGVSRYSILSFTGMPEPSDKECQEGSHRCVRIGKLVFENNNNLKYLCKI
jgi:hypothetical protein